MTILGLGKLETPPVETHSLQMISVTGSESESERLKGFSSRISGDLMKPRFLFPACLLSYLHAEHCTVVFPVVHGCLGVHSWSPHQDLFFYPSVFSSPASQSPSRHQTPTSHYKIIILAHTTQLPILSVTV